MKLKVSKLLMLYFLSQHLFSQTADNQLQGDLRVHDPVMIKEGDTYYIFHTGQGVSMKSSTDMVNWTNYDRVFPKDQLPSWHQDDIPEQTGHLWAPDIHFRDGKYHLYYSVSAWMNFNSSIGYATNATLDTASTSYEWKDHGMVISFENGGEGVNVIDPNIFVEDDGSVWMAYGSFQTGMRLVELDAETGKLQNDSPELITLTTSLGEGVFIIKGHGYYYIFASRGICCKGLESTYQIVIGRSKTLQGPYANKQNESWHDNQYSVFLAGDESEPGRGHNGIFTENDTTYVVYHAYTASEGGKPLLNIKPLYIDENLWPTLDSEQAVFQRD